MARISLQALAAVCHRTATAHAAGVDVRTIWKREAEQGSSANRREFGKVSKAIEKGSTLADAFNLTGNYLPRLMRDMIHVGERTGRVDETLNRLGQYYEHMRSIQTAFLVGIAWPAIQFVIAVLLIGLVIFIMGMIQEKTGMDIDMVGFGLSGASGAAIYFTFVGILFVAGFFFIRSLINGKLSSVVMTPLMKVPKFGVWLQLMAMSRMAWALGMSIESGMSAKACAEVALRSTQNSHFTKHTKNVKASIGRGETLYEAFSATDVFSVDFLDAVRVGEESGRLGESMNVLSRHYEERGKAAMQALAVFAGIVVWGFVASVIIYFIFKFATFYVDLLQNVSNGNF